MAPEQLGAEEQAGGPDDHESLGAAARADMGIADGLVRFSVGLEDPQDLIDDLDQALRLG